MSPPRIADMLKKHLLAEVIHAEWELVDEWKDPRPEPVRPAQPGSEQEGGRPRALSPFSDLGTVTGSMGASVAGSGATSPDEVRNVSPTSQRQMSGRGKPLAETVVLGEESFANLDYVGAETAAGQRQPGINGWTRVKPRPQ